MSETPPSEPTGSMVGARYRFLSRIARGGMAELFLGEATAAGGVSRKVALKRILPKHAVETEYLEMFLDEARLLAQLQHSNIVQTYDVVHSGDEYVIVMELLEGADLYQLKRKMRGSKHVMTLSHVLYVATSLLNGLHYAHEARGADGQSLGIVHRDVSPQNIFLTYDGGVKLLDFGIAKTMARQDLRTESGVLKGKVRYMSPEQCTGQPIDRRADIYAAGAVLYQMLTGVVPHRGKTPIQTMRNILEIAPVPPHEMDSRIDPVLSQIVLRALAKNPAERYATARDLQLDLERYVEEAGLFLSAPMMSEFVEKVLGPRGTFVQNPTGDRSEVGSLTSGAGPRRSDATPPPPASATVQVLFESTSAVVKRLNGVLLLELYGTIDERFDRSAFAALLRGDVVVDTSGVTRITSFGIRQILTLFTETHGHVDGIWHARCSVAWMLQVAMIRNLLGGGKILSFHAPFVDGADGRAFSHLLRGEEAAEAVRSHHVPAVPSPSNPEVPAVFDDDPEVYFNLDDDFQAEAPRHLRAALQLVEENRRRPLDVELIVNDDRSVLHIRSSLRNGRWRRAVLGLEGAVVLDLTDVEPPQGADARALVEALDSITDDLSELRLVGVPIEVVGAVTSYPLVRAVAQVESVVFTARCAKCGAERRARVAWTDSLANQAPAVDPCAKCGGATQPTADLAAIRVAWGSTPSPTLRTWSHPSATPVSLDRDPESNTHDSWGEGHPSTSQKYRALLDARTPLEEPSMERVTSERPTARSRVTGQNMPPPPAPAPPSPHWAEARTHLPMGILYLFAGTFVLAFAAVLIAVVLFVSIQPS